MKKLFKRKIIISFLIVIVVGGYFGYQNFAKNENNTSHTLASVEKGTLVVSVSGSGQVAALNQITVKPEVSGKVTSLKVANGDKISAGDLLFTVDTTDYQQAVAEAETALETAQLDLDELLAPPDELTLLQSQNAVAKAHQTKDNAKKNIATGYEDSFNAIINVFFELPTIITGVRDVLYSYTIAQGEITINDSDWNVSVYQNSLLSSDQGSIKPFIAAAEQDYAAARAYYDQNLDDYKNTGYNATNEDIGSLLDETAATAKAIAQAVKSEINLLDFVNDYFTNHNVRVFSQITSYRSSLKSYYSQVNGYVQSLSSAQKTLVNNEQTLTDAEISLKEKQLALSDLEAGADELTIRSKQNTVKQKEQALETAKENLNNCHIFASMSGTIAEVNIKTGDTVSSGTNAITLISQQSVGEITLNETDVANVKVGQKVTITFDALEDLTVTGKVVDVDTLGQVSQGVVDYGATISLDTGDERVKPGMTITVDIITNVKQDVLLIPTAALKKQNGSYYVQVVGNSSGSNTTASVSGAVSTLKNQDIKNQSVEVGLANDTMIEVASGLKGGEVIISQTVSSSNNTSLPNSSQIRSSGGMMQMQFMR